ncbi:MAG: hypothetical protein C0518_00535 [Opitutus sp.]|nr:hypothetical protein [Opitutus sp.]
MKPAATHDHRYAFPALAVLSLGLAWFWMAHISATDPWYRNTDMNIHNMADALSLNSGFPPGVVDQPAAPTKFLLALDYRIRNALGALPNWTLKRVARSPEPLREIAQLVKVGRVHSQWLVIASILVGAAFIGRVTRRFDLACFTVVLLSGSSGLIFHGLLVRPELLCATFGGLLATHALWSATESRGSAGRSLWLAVAGMFLGLALISKLPAVLYVALAFGWCCFASLPFREDQSAENRPSGAWAIGICLTAAIAALLLLRRISPMEDVLNPAATIRLRIAATTVALAPLVLLAAVRGKFAHFAVGRVMDFALLLAGMLLCFVGWFGLLRAVLPAGAAESYIAKVLTTTVYPEPLLRLFTVAEESHRWREMGRFFLETPVLFPVTTGLAIAIAGLRAMPARIRLLTVLLLLQGLGMVFLLSKRQFLEQYSVFAQIPLLMIWALGFFALECRENDRRGPRPKWPMALAATGATLLVITLPVALVPKYSQFQPDAEVPVRGLTITFLYDHDAHPPAYLTAMKQRYPTREEFAAELNKFLSDPANRY